MRVFLRLIALAPAFLTACSSEEIGATYLCDGTEEVIKLENGQGVEKITRYHRMILPIRNKMFGDNECVIFNKSEIKCQSKTVNNTDTGEPDYWIQIDRTSGTVNEKHETATERSFFSGKCVNYRGS